MDQRVEVFGTTRPDVNGKCGRAIDFHTIGGVGADRADWRELGR